MSIEKRRTGYTVRWRDSTGTARSRQVGLWRDAIALDGEMKRKKAMGELITHERGTIRLMDFWDVWWKNYALVHLSPRSRDNYERLWLKHIKPALGRQQLRSITREDVSALVAALTTKLAPASVRNAIAVLQSVLTAAVEWGYIGASPAARIKKPKLAGRQRRGWALDAEQYDALLLELPSLRDTTIAVVLARVGLRPGELRALYWLDRTPSGLHVSHAASSNLIGPTKTGAVRFVPTEPGIFDEWYLARGRPQRGLVFPGANGRLWTDQGWRMWQRQTFAPAAKRAGLEGLRPYDLRHTYITNQIRAGRDVIEVAARAGNSPEITLRYYAHEFKSVYSACTANANEARIPRARLRT